MTWMAYNWYFIWCHSTETQILSVEIICVIHNDYIALNKGEMADMIIILIVDDIQCWLSNTDK